MPPLTAHQLTLLSYQIQSRLFAAHLLAAIAANPADDQPVAVDTESLFPRYLVADAVDLVAVELDELIALLTVQVIVPRIAVVVLVDRAAAEVHLPQEARVNQLRQAAIDRGTTDAA